MNNGLECIFDWLQFTIPMLDPESVILQILNYDPANFTQLPKGRYGYKGQLYYQNIHVLYDGTPEMGVHVIMTGQGCREYETRGDILELLDKVMYHDGKCTRIDLAIDDKTGEIIEFDEMVKSVKKGHVISKWRISTEIIKRNLQDGSIIGHTINFGSRSSKVYMRVYDKAMQQELDTPWYRMELEIKDDRAEVLQWILLFEDEIGKTVAGIINNYIRFVIPADDTNKSRWPTAPWWKELIRATNVVKLTRKPEEKDIEEVREWVRHQIGPTLAMIVMYDEGELGPILDIISAGRHRMKDKHYRMIDRGHRKG